MSRAKDHTGPTDKSTLKRAHRLAGEIINFLEDQGVAGPDAIAALEATKGIYTATMLGETMIELIRRNLSDA